jgi:hypothetical protein
MKKTKILVLTLTICFCAAIFVACGGGSSSEDSNPGGNNGGGGGGGEGGTGITYITDLQASPGNESLTLTWNDPETGFDHIKIVDSNGLLIWNILNKAIEESDPIIIAAGVQTYAFTHLKNGHAYTYKVQSVDAGGTVTSELSVTATPVMAGAPSNAVYIYNNAEMNNVRNDLSGYYILMKDLDLSAYSSGEGWVPIGTDTSGFSGTFDGNSHLLYKFTINRTAGSYQGLFGYITTGSEIKNLGVVGCSVAGSDNVGLLAGYNYGGTISNSYTDGIVSGSQNIGGMTGYNNGIISNSYAAANITGTNNLGGLTGYNTGIINSSYAIGNVSGTGTGIGGLAGANDDGTINNSYAVGDASGNSYIGGLIGFNDGTISKSYSAGSVSGNSNLGGFVGYNNTTTGTISGCYYDSQASGQSDTGRGTPKTTAEMQTKSTYNGWDFAGESANGTADIWSIDSAFKINSGYPYYTNNVQLDVIYIYTASDMNNVPNNLAGNYILMADISLSGYASGQGWIPIGTNASRFTGTFDGNGHVISGLVINRPSGDYQGLFGYIESGGEVNNLIIDNCSISARNQAGSITGINSGIISKSHSTGAVSGGICTGGLAGQNIEGIINDSYSACNVSGTGGNSIGGLCGANYDGNISNSYSIGNVSGSDYLGGFIGTNTGGIIHNTYSKGAVTGSSRIGGLIGYGSGTISNSYAIGTVSGGYYTGGLIGYNSSATISNCYYDRETTGQSDTGKGTPKTTAEMKTQSTFAGWDFADETANGSEDIWSIDSTQTINSGYPYLTDITPVD